LRGQPELRGLSRGLLSGRKMGEAAMPRFFFHIRQGGELERDAAGLELSDIEAARHEAVQRACAIWSKNPPDPEHNDHTFEIADEKGETVLIVSFSEAFAERAVT